MIGIESRLAAVQQVAKPPPTQRSFLELPPEIRNLVYRHLLVAETDIQLDKKPQVPINIFLVSKQTYLEACTVFWSFNSFNADSLRIFKKTSKEALQLIKRLTVNGTEANLRGNPMSHNIRFGHIDLHHFQGLRLLTINVDFEHGSSHDSVLAGPRKAYNKEPLLVMHPILHNAKPVDRSNPIFPEVEIWFNITHTQVWPAEVFRTEWNYRPLVGRKRCVLPPIPKIKFVCQATRVLVQAVERVPFSGWNVVDTQSERVEDIAGNEWLGWQVIMRLKRDMAAYRSGH